ncbi:hypothetical protein SMICM17S_11461 [Streptomyces microflavus]
MPLDQARGAQSRFGDRAQSREPLSGTPGTRQRKRQLSGPDTPDGVSEPFCGRRRTAGQSGIYGHGSDSFGTDEQV